MDGWVIIPVSIALSAGFAGWLAWRAIKKRPLKIHLVMYGIAVIASILSIVFFMTMDIPTIGKVLGAITLGGVLIYLAGRAQRRKETKKPRRKPATPPAQR